jgi:hypothetical protein
VCVCDARCRSDAARALSCWTPPHCPDFVFCVSYEDYQLPTNLNVCTTCLLARGRYSYDTVSGLRNHNQSCAMWHMSRTCAHVPDRAVSCRGRAGADRGTCRVCRAAVRLWPGGAPPRDAADTHDHTSKRLLYGLTSCEGGPNSAQTPRCTGTADLMGYTVYGTLCGRNLSQASRGVCGLAAVWLSKDYTWSLRAGSRAAGMLLLREIHALVWACHTSFPAAASLAGGALCTIQRERAPNFRARRTPVG